jgi:hypothetical protein
MSGVGCHIGKTAVMTAAGKRCRMVGIILHAMVNISQ